MNNTEYSIISCYYVLIELIQKECMVCMSFRIDSSQDKPEMLAVAPIKAPQDHLPLAVSPRFNWKDVETSYVGSSSIGEEQLTRQLIGLHRAVTHKDKGLLNQIVKQGTEMSLPLRGVTALSLTLYLRHMDMTSELLAALRKTKQLGKN